MKKADLMWLAVIVSMGGALGCGDIAPIDDGTRVGEDLDREEGASTLAAGQKYWPMTDGVVTIPYQIVAPDAGGVPLEDQTFLQVIDYVQAATHSRFHFEPGATSGSRVKFKGAPAWNEHPAQCDLGRHAPTTCSFRLSRVVAVAHRKDGSANPLRVYFADGTFRSSTLDDLNPCEPGKDGCDQQVVTFPINPVTGTAYTAGDVDAIDQLGDTTYAWYRNGYMSKGVEGDLGSRVAPRTYKRYINDDVKKADGTPSNVSLSLMAVALSPAGKVHAFWLDGRAKLNGETRLLHTLGPSSADLVGGPTDEFYVTLPSNESPGDIIAMVYSEDTNLQTYLATTRFTGNRGEIAAIGAHSVGMTGQGTAFHVVLHELTHGLGMRHEHQRCDRDLYLRVTRGDSTNYGLKASDAVVGGYDFASTMQYDSASGFLRVDGSPFSKNRTGYSWRDLRGLLVHYGLTDPLASTAEETRVVADYNGAAALTGRSPIYSLAAGRISGDLVGVDVDLGTNKIYSYYAGPGADGVTRLTGSVGTPYDLARYSTAAEASCPDGGAQEEVAIRAPGLSPPQDIVAVALSDGQAIAWFRVDTGTCASGLSRTRGSYIDFTTVWGPACVSLPVGYTAANIRDIARHRYGGVTRFITVYDDGKLSVGDSTSLASASGGVFEVALPDVAPAYVQGFAINRGAGLFFLGCNQGEGNCHGAEYRFVNLPNFVASLPAQFQ